MKPTCWYCGIRLTKENKSLEHIIPDSIGGDLFLKSDNLLCNQHNSEFGSSIDIEANQLNNFTVLLGLPRKKKKNKREPEFQGISIKHKIYKGGLKGKGKFSVIYQLPNMDHEISFFKDTKKMALKELNKRISPYYKKIGEPSPDLNKMEFKPIISKGEKIFLTNHENENNQSQPICRFGGDNFNKLLLKCMINFFAYKDSSLLEQVPYAIDYLKDPKKTWSVKLYYPISDVIDLNCTEKIYHGITLMGVPDQGILICFISLFSFIQGISILSWDYSGPHFETSHFIDLSHQPGTILSLPLNFIRTRKYYFDFFSRDVIFEGERRSFVKKYNSFEIKLNQFLDEHSKDKTVE